MSEVPLLGDEQYFLLVRSIDRADLTCDWTATLVEQDVTKEELNFVKYFTKLQGTLYTS